MSQDKIAEWIDSQKSKHQNASLRLRHIAAPKPSTVDEWRLDKYSAMDLADKVWNLAGHDATMYSGMQRYELMLVVMTDGKTEDKARFGFRMDAGTVDEQGETPQINDVFVGFMKQTFSHNEVLMRTLVQVVTAG